MQQLDFMCCPSKQESKTKVHATVNARVYKRALARNLPVGEDARDVADFVAVAVSREL